MSTQQRRLVIRGAILALLIVLIFALSRYGPQPFTVLSPFWEELEDLQAAQARKEQIIAFLSSFGPYSSAIFVLLQALQVVVAPIPGELTGVVGGFVYGQTYGFILSTVGLTLGSWVAFELASILGRPFVEKLFKKELLAKFDFLTTNTGATITFLLFLVPGFPKDFLCFVLGLSRMRLSTFLIVSTIGRLPGTYFLTIQGASVRNQDYSTTVIFAVVSAALLFLAYIYRLRLFLWIKSRHVHSSIKLVLLSCLLLNFAADISDAGPAVIRTQKALQLAQVTPLSFNAWRPYNNPNKIVQVGMNKGQVLAIAGKPDHEDSYYQGSWGRSARISDWYYVKSGLNAETALLKFSGDSLVTISVTPIQ